MPAPIVTAALSQGFAFARKHELGRKAARALKKGFSQTGKDGSAKTSGKAAGFWNKLATVAKGARLTANDSGVSLTAPGLNVQTGQRASGFTMPQASQSNWLPYAVGGAILLMLMRK